MSKTPFQLALITGASSGIGTALCYRVAKEGIPLVITGRNKKQLDTLAATLSVPAEVIIADLATEEGVAIVQKAIEKKEPDLVVNNAGMGLYGKACDLTIDKQRAMLRLNSESVMALTIAAANVLQSKKREGVVLNVSSVAAYQVFPCFSLYAASKAFVNVFTESMAHEFEGTGIHLLVACPGQVDTQFRSRAADGVEQKKERGVAMTAEYAAEQLWWQIVERKAVYIFDWRYRIGTFLTRYLLPKTLVANVLRRSIESRV